MAKNGDIKLAVDSIGRAGITDLEICDGSRNAREWDQDMADLSVIDLVETTSEYVQRARQVQRPLASRSQRGAKDPRSADCRHGRTEPMTLLHYDAGFDLISKVIGQQWEWAAQAGSID